MAAAERAPAFPRNDTAPISTEAAISQASARMTILSMECTFWPDFIDLLTCALSASSFFSKSSTFCCRQAMSQAFPESCAWAPLFIPNTAMPMNPAKTNRMINLHVGGSLRSASFTSHRSSARLQIPPVVATFPLFGFSNVSRQRIRQARSTRFARFLHW